MGDTATTDESGPAPLAGRWWHSIDLGGGVTTSGHKSLSLLAKEYDNLQVDVRGRSVLDIGAWDGYFSFEAERRGAERVVALDHYVWSMDPRDRQRYLDECASRGEVPKPFHQVPNVWRPEELPGKACFDVAHRALASKVEAVVGDFMSIDLAPLGTFDCVFFLGVLYHLEDPIQALSRLASLTREVAVIETEAIHVPGRSRAALWEAYPATEMGGDPTNWWAPTESALSQLCRSAGFRDVVTTVDRNGPARRRGAARLAARARRCAARTYRHGWSVSRYRLTLQAWK